MKRQTSQSNRDPHKGMFLPSTINKEILSELRGGDYQHPGEEEAIEMVFSKITKKPQQLLLDIGCGRGGTTHYLQQKKWGRVVGIDINGEVLKTARERYGATLNYEEKIDPKKVTNFPAFLCCDVIDIKQEIEHAFVSDIKFDVVFIFGALCLMPNHVKVLQKLKEVSHKQTRLAVFDYIDYGDYLVKKPYAENGKILLSNCIKYDEINATFLAGGWGKPTVDTIDKEFIFWYRALMKKIVNDREKYSAKYGKKVFAIVEQRYRHILDALEDGILGGAIIYTQAEAGKYE